MRYSFLQTQTSHTVKIYIAQAINQTIISSDVAQKKKLSDVTSSRSCYSTNLAFGTFEGFLLLDRIIKDARLDMLNVELPLHLTLVFLFLRF